MGGYRYRDVYDFNPAVQFLLNGDVFKIDGSIDKKDRGGSVKYRGGLMVLASSM